MNRTNVGLLALIVVSSTAFADPVDPVASIRRNWMPNRCEQRNSFGDPIVTAAQSMFSSRWDDDVSVETPRGRFSITRIYAGDRRALGQVDDDGVEPECRAPIIGRLTPGFIKSPYGGNFWSVHRANALLQTNSLMSVVDTRCPGVTRVLTPGGDTRFFGLVPALSNNQSAWVPRVGFANGEPSRLKAGKNGAGALWFEWYSETGQRLTYSAQGAVTNQFVLSSEHNVDGSLFYTINWGHPAIAQTTLPSTALIPERGYVSCPFFCRSPEDTEPLPPATELDRCTFDGTCTSTCPASTPTEVNVGLHNLVCVDTQWDRRHCGSAHAACAAGQYCRAGVCTANPKPCEMSLMPLSVTFPDTALFLQLEYGNPAPSDTNPAYYSPECLLVGVNAVSFSNQEPLVQYDYANATVVSGFLVSRFDKAVFAPLGGPNAWTKLIRGDNGSGPYRETTWALGITETRRWDGGIALPGGGNGENPDFVTTYEHIATHRYPRELGSADLMLLEQGASSELFATIGAPSFQLAACTNCCSSDLFVRPVSVANYPLPPNTSGVKLIKMSYFGLRLEDGQLSEWESGSSMLANAREEICLSPGDDCQSSVESYFYGKVAHVGAPAELLACSAATQPVALLAQQNKNGAFSRLDVRFNSTEERQETRGVMLGATDPSGADALYSENMTYSYINAGQVISQTQHESVLDSAEVKTTYRRSGNFLTAVIRQGRTLIDGSIVNRFVGTFFVRGRRPCSSSGSNGTDIVAVIGPCYVDGEEATSCLSSTTSGGGVSVPHDVPLTEYFYYGDDDPQSVVTQSKTDSFNSGRISLIRRFPHYPANCLDSVDTVYGSYDGFGNPGSIVDSNGHETIINRTGGLATLIQLATGDTYRFDYDRGRITRITRPEADATVICTQPSAWLAPNDPFCWRTNVGPTGPPPGNGGAGSSPPLQANGGLFGEPNWIADVAPPPGLKTVRAERFLRQTTSSGTLVKQFTHGALDPGFDYNFWQCIDDPYYITDQKCESLRSWSYDFEGRMKAASSGNNEATFSSSRFDVSSNLVASGAGIDFADTGAPDAFCRSGGNDDPRCTLFSYDRLNRLSGTWWRGTTSEDCVSHDKQGNISVIARSCFNDGHAYGSICGTPAPTTVNNLSVVGGPSCGERFEYVWDDFGRLVATNRLSGNGVTRTKYEYDLTGNLLKKQSQEQQNTGELSWTKHDGLGRLYETSVSKNNDTWLLTTQQWDDAIAAPTGCLASFPSLNQRNLKGRVGYSHDPVWDTWFAYDALGRIVGERRVRADVLQNGLNCNGGGGDGNTQKFYNTTRYTYTPNGNLATITYPSGRLVRYVYDSTGQRLDNNLPTQIEISLSTGSASFETTLASEIEWTADKRLKSYVLHNYAALKPSDLQAVLASNVRVDFQYSSVDLGVRPDTCKADPKGFDASGRLRRMRVVSLDTDTVLYQRWYTWKADQIAAIDVCYSPLQSEPYNELNAMPAFSFDGQRRLVLNGVHPEADELSLNNLLNRSYMYNQNGRREWEEVNDVSWGNAGGWEYSYTGSLLTSRYAAPARWSPAWWGGETTYEYDADGRQTRRNAAEDSNGQPTASVDYVFPPSTGLGGGGIDVALRAVTLNSPGFQGLHYEYFYDRDNKRIEKVYPNGATEDFFYDLEKRLIAERSFAGVHEDESNFIWDEYIYLGGMPIAMIRSTVDNRSSYTQVADFEGAEGDIYISGSGACSRRNEWGFCAIVQLVADYQGKPVLALNHHQNIMGVGEYDAFGFRNRAQTPCLYAGTNGDFSSCGSAGNASNLGKRQLKDTNGAPLAVQNDFRLRLAFLDAPPPCTPATLGCSAMPAQVRVLDSSWNEVSVVDGRYPNMVSEWVTGVDFRAYFDRGSSTSGYGAFLDGYEYDRHTGNVRYFPPLRFPGQYYDAETDLHENWNRFYDPTTGDYTTVEPLLQSPRYIRQMTQRGLSVPTYAYAANNPLRYVDLNGREIAVVGDTGAQISAGWALGEMLANPSLGNATARAMMDPVNIFVLNPRNGNGLEPFGGGRTTSRNKRSGGGFVCQSAVSMDSFRNWATDVRWHRNLPLDPNVPWHTWTTLLGHEFGHQIADIYLGGDADPRLSKDVALHFENELRAAGGLGFRPSHEWPTASFWGPAK